jgi:hypothetical protein
MKRRTLMTSLSVAASVAAISLGAVTVANAFSVGNEAGAPLDVAPVVGTGVSSGSTNPDGTPTSSPAPSLPTDPAAVPPSESTAPAAPAEPAAPAPAPAAPAPAPAPAAPSGGVTAVTPPAPAPAPVSDDDDDDDGADDDAGDDDGDDD